MFVLIYMAVVNMDELRKNIRFTRYCDKMDNRHLFPCGGLYHVWSIRNIHVIGNSQFNLCKIV